MSNISKRCQQCQLDFIIYEADQEFYHNMSPIFAGIRYDISLPTLCPSCRMQRKMNWRSELHLFNRKSNLSGKPIISFYPETAPVVVYSNEEWWSDDWSGLDYGRDFDFKRSFFEQFEELQQIVPRPAMSAGNNDNAEYTNCSGNCKNCYMLGGVNFNEDCLYGNFLNRCQDCVDCNFINNCELCYECVDCKDCYNVKYSSNSYNCNDSYFLKNCRSCNNCFGSVNLVNKQYYFFNKQLSQEEYQEKLDNLELHKRSTIQNIWSQFESHCLKYPHRFMIGEMNENVTGNVMNSCKNTKDCFDVNELEDCKYCHWFHKAKDCMDCYSWGWTAEKTYECTEVGQDSHTVAFSVTTWTGHDIWYCFNTRNCKHLFGCISLKNKEYCILNKQYTKEEYEILVPKIIHHMKETGEWGEFFPMSLCPLAYNQTVAQDYMPIDAQKAKNLGAHWNEEKTVQLDSVSHLPDSIFDADETVCNGLYSCERSHKPYKIIAQELAFYKKNTIPLPSLCFEQRHQNRLYRRLPRRLWSRNCDKCGKEMDTSFAPEREERVYCDECYLESVY